MKDKTLKILLGIIAINLTFQTVKDVGLFPTAFAQSYSAQGVQKVAVCSESGFACVDLTGRDGGVRGLLYGLHIEPNN